MVRPHSLLLHTKVTFPILKASKFKFHRWRLWLERCLEDLRHQRDYDAGAVVKEMVEFTHRWIEADNLHSFVSEPLGNVVSLSEKLYQKYREEAWVLEMNI